MRGFPRGPEQSGLSLLRRRDFLAFGSAGLLSLCFNDLAWGQSLRSGEGLTRPMPVGYLEGSDHIQSLRKLPLRIRRPRMATEESVEREVLRIAPADHLPMGDTSLVGPPLRLTIHGLYPPAALSPKLRAEIPLAIDLEVLFPSPDPAFPDPIRFFAWSFRRWPGWNPSPPVSFTFPLDWQALPALAMRVVPANGGPSLSLRTQFTLDYETGQPRLLRGVYVLGTTPGAWRSNVALPDLARTAPASLVSVLMSVEPEIKLHVQE